jgi:MurNAc alpha-1-phosphate uridylyltransferase
VKFVLVDNPPCHALGDMGLSEGLVTRGGPRLTYGNISVFHPALFREIAPGTALRLFPWAYRFVDEGRVSGERYSGPWDNVGTADQLAALQERIAP